MATQFAPLVSLQAPKDVPLSQIESELAQIWQLYSTSSDEGAGAMRAATFTLIIYEPEELQYLLASLGFYRGPLDGIWGPQMISAVKDAQKAFGLERTGKTSAGLLARAREAATQRAAQGQGVAPEVVGQKAVGAMADAIASQNPCRIITLMPASGNDEGVVSQVSVSCPIQKRSQSTLVCGEYITLKATEVGLHRSTGLVASLLIGELPKYLWWKAAPEAGNELFRKLGSLCDLVIVDSSGFQEPETELANLQSLLQDGLQIGDLNWSRLAAWQELTAEAFDPPQRRAALKEVDRVVVDFEKGNSSQALMFAGWLASRLQWKPVAYKREMDMYDVHTIQFVASDQRVVVVELGGVPVSDAGDVAGDLIGLRLNSTNLEADCCTLLCSEVAGCMRMESGGAAQNCRVFQVTTSLADQNAEVLLSQQLQRWGRDELYVESMQVVSQILQVAGQSL
jgi:glucose-6-phosphate dehydrogenase assembly protein OpcA